MGLARATTTRHHLSEASKRSSAAMASLRIHRVVGAKVMVVNLDDGIDHAAWHALGCTEDPQAR